MISEEKFLLLKDWAVITHLNTPKPIDVLYGCIIAGALVVELPDNAAIFIMERTEKLNLLTTMVAAEHLKLQRSYQ